jgi:hypothetical protein
MTLDVFMYFVMIGAGLSCGITLGLLPAYFFYKKFINKKEGAKYDY